LSVERIREDLAELILIYVRRGKDRFFGVLAGEGRVSMPTQRTAEGLGVGLVRAKTTDLDDTNTQDHKSECGLCHLHSLIFHLKMKMQSTRSTGT
jgi:hypothetical protein